MNPNESPRSHRNTASFGKRQEYIAIAELLKRGYDVYMTLVDDQQIDCIVRHDTGVCVKYVELQIKARSKTAKYYAKFGGLKHVERENYLLLLYAEKLDKYWVIPSCELPNLGNIQKNGTYFCHPMTKKLRHEFSKYEGFGFLESYLKS